MLDYDFYTAMNYELLSDIVREELAPGYRPNACIVAARVTGLVLARLGIDSQAIACELDAFSPAYVQMMHASMALDRQPDAAEIADWAERGAWRVSASFSPPHPGMVNHRTENGYFGHVVTLADERRWLIDPTIAQVDRPQKGLVVKPPYAFALAPEDYAGRFLAVETAAGTVLAYRLLPGRRDFTRTPDWRAPGPRKAAMRCVIDRVTRRIEQAER